MAINIVSYNISRSPDLLDVVESYISKKCHTIVFVQESPYSDKSTLSARANGKNYTAFENPHGNVVTFITNDLVQSKIKPISCIDSHDRYQIISTQIGHLVNVHMPPRSSDRSRDTKCSKLSELIKGKISENSIIGGDFNDNPFDQSLIYPENWYAKRTIKEIPRHKKHKGMINPFWGLMKQNFNEIPRGTIVANHSEPMGYGLFDQVLLSKLFAPKILSYGIIMKLGNKKIEELNKSAKGIFGTPHWPVYVSLDLGVV